MSCRVLLAEDQPLIRESLRQLIEGEPGLSVVAAAADGREAVALCADHAPDIALLDIRMPSMDGLEAARAIKAAGTAGKIVLLTTFSDEEAMREGVSLGADGILLKDIEPDAFALALRSVAAGLLVFHPLAAAALGPEAACAGEPAAKDSFGLTERDMEVVRLIVRGRGNKEIAREQNCSEGTVKNRVSAILSKMGLEARTQIAVFAVKNRLVVDLD